MEASDIMSSPVVSVEPQTPVVQVAALLREHRFGGLPVVLGRQIVGIVTEKDLLHRQEIGTEHREATGWWRRIVDHNLGPQRYVKSHGRRAQHVMTRRVIVVDPWTSLQHITALFERHGIGRVPVVRDHRLVGIVAAADLVKALSQGPWAAPARGAGIGDAAILAALMAELQAQDWWNGSLSAVDVTQGVVRFTGFFENDGQRRASQVAAENVAGVRRVVDARQDMAELPSML